ncbi:hypothetical protein T01_13892, partial [Trichinella spiralis]
LEVLLQHSRFFKQIIQYSDITPGTLVPFVTRKLKVLLQHSRFFKQIIQYSDITPGRQEGVQRLSIHQPGCNTCASHMEACPVDPH